MKTKLIIALTLLTFGVKSQSVKSVCYDLTGWHMTYENNLGLVKDTLLTNVSSNLIGVFNSKLDSMPKQLKKVDYVDYRYDIFSITVVPVNGNTFKQVTRAYSELSTGDKAIITAFKAKILESKGVNVTSFYTKFGSNAITINGVEYPYSDFSDESIVILDDIEHTVRTPYAEFVNAIILANRMVNEN